MDGKIKIGQYVRDRVTGFVGRVTARCEYLDAPPGVRVEAQVGPDNRPNSMWLEETRVEEQPATAAAG